MHWTSEKPTEEGFWWYRGKDQPPRVLEIKRDVGSNPGLFVRQRHNARFDGWHSLDRFPGEWGSEAVLMPTEKPPVEVAPMPTQVARTGHARPAKRPPPPNPMPDTGEQTPSARRRGERE